MKKFLCFLVLILSACEEVDTDITALADGRKVHHYGCQSSSDVRCQITIGKKCPNGFEIVKHEGYYYLFICHDKFNNPIENTK